MITIVTATYNRASLLRRCYKSLCQQSRKDFEWLIVDDGSTDETAELVGEWIGRGELAIRFIRQSNGGKHRALNRALREPMRKFALLLDSDDALSRDAVEVLVEATSSLPESCVGFVGNCYDMSSSRVLGTAIPCGVDSATGRQLRERLGVCGDTLRVYRTEILRRHRFPEFSGENFVPENVVFDVIDEEGPLSVIRGRLCLCEYQPQGLSAEIARLRALNPRGFAASLESSAWAARKSVEVVKSTLKYQIWSRQFLGVYGAEAFRRRFIFLACLPFAVVLNALHRPRFIFSSRALARTPQP